MLWIPCQESPSFLGVPWTLGLVDREVPACRFLRIVLECLSLRHHQACLHFHQTSTTQRLTAVRITVYPQSSPCACFLIDRLLQSPLGFSFSWQSLNHCSPSHSQKLRSASSNLPSLQPWSRTDLAFLSFFLTFFFFSSFPSFSIIHCGGSAHACHTMFGGQKTTLGSQFLPPTVWMVGTKLRSLGWAVNDFTRLNHLSSPNVLFLSWVFLCP